MLINFDNTGYIKVCEHTNLPVEDKYIPASTWGFIRGDISEQKDLMELLTTIESGLTPEQIELIVDTDEKLNDVESKIVEMNSDIDASLLLINQSIITLETADVKLNKDIEDLEFRVNEDLNLKADADKVYTKTEIDGKGYATESWIYSKGYLSAETDPVWSAEKHKYALKTDLPSVAGYATESWVNERLLLKANISDVYTKTEIDNKGYLTQHQSLDNYYTKGEVDTAISNVEVDLTGYATESWVKEQGYLTEHQSLNNYYTKTEVDTALENVEVNVDLTGYATETWVKEQGYLTQHQSLTGYATEKWVNDGLLSKANISDVYTKTEIDNKGYITQHQSLDNYYTKTEVDTAISNVEVDLTGYATETYVNTAISTKVDTNQIWTGTQSEWDALSTEQQNSYIIAMIEL